MTMKLDVDALDVTAALETTEPPAKTCERCGSTNFHARAPGIVECVKCSAREAFGHRMPRVVVQPHPEDARFIVVTYDDEHQFVLDRALAKMLATAIISIT